MDYVEYGCDQLKTHGYRVTASRTRVLALLNGEERALSPYDMRNCLRAQGLRMDVVTVYRALEVLERLGLVHRIYSTGGFVRCRREDLDGHHHHLVCSRCSRVAEITGDQLDEVVTRVETESGYRVAGHILELFGLCVACQAHPRGLA